MALEKRPRAEGQTGGTRGPWARMASLAVTSSIILSVLAMWTGFGDTVGFPKLLVVVGCAFLAVWPLAGNPRLWLRIVSSPIFGPLALLGVWAVLSALVTAFPAPLAGADGSWNGALTLCACITLALASANTGRAMPAWVAVSVPVVAYEFLQAFSLDPFGWNQGLKSSYWLFSTLGNPVHLGTFLAGVFWLTFPVMRRGGPAAWLLRLALLAGVFMTRSRSGILALGAGFLAWLPVRGSLQAGLMAGAFPLFTMTATGGFDRIFALTRLAGARAEIWKGAGRLLRESPFIGRGLDNLHSLFPAVASYAYFVAEPPSLSGTMVSLRLPASAHNLPVDVAFGTGVVGLGLLLWVLAAAFRAGKRSPFLPALVAVLTASLTNPFSPPTALMFWMLVAAVAGRRTVGAGPGPAGIASPRVPRVILSGLLVGFLSLLLRQSLFQAHAREAGRLSYLGRTADLEAHLGRWSGWSVSRRPGQTIADAALYRGIWEANPARREPAERAEALLKEAGRGGERLFAVSALADLELALGKAWKDPARMEKAEALAREAVALAPAVASLKSDLADIVEARGRKAEAKALREQAITGDPAKVFRP